MKTLILFDIDGTLIGPCRGHGRLMEHVVAQVHGITVSLTKIDGNGKTDWQIFRDLLALEGISNQSCDVKLPEYLAATAECLQNFITPQDVTLLPAVPETLKLLSKAGYGLGLITGNFEAIAWHKMRLCALRDWLVVGGFGSEHWDRSELVKLAIQKYAQQLVAPDRIVVVGDTPRDVAAARRAGTQIVAIATGRFNASELQTTGPDAVIARMDELPLALERLL